MRIYGFDKGVKLKGKYKLIASVNRKGDFMGLTPSWKLEKKDRRKFE